MSALNGHITRHTKAKPCPICGGGDQDVRGQGTRCFGFISGKWIHCSREEHAGNAAYLEKSKTYLHVAKGPCPCGKEHAPGEPAVDPRNARDHIYKYRDQEGKVLFEVVRTKNPKGFYQRRPGTNGKPINGLGGVTPVLYNLPVLKTTDPSVTVWVCEGEKDADRLGSYDLVATTNPMGAGKWRDEYSETLRGRAVAILPDNDEPGRKHALEVAQSLQGKAVSVKVVELPGLPAKGDVSDWLDAGGTVDRLRELLRETSEWTPTTTPEFVPVASATMHAGNEAIAETDDRPVILVTHEEFEVNDQAIAALGADTELYQRNLKLVTVAIDEKTSKAEGIRRAEGTPLIRPVQPARLREDLTRVARWMKARTTRDGEVEMIPTHPPDWSVAAIMARENWANIRRLVAIIEAPTLRPDGSVIEKPGFDEATGLLYIPNQDFPQVPIRPTRADAEAAVRDLLDLISDFPFKDGHNVAWLAALLTAMCRLLIDGPVPLFLFEANVSGAGKTLLCDLIAIIVTGRPMTRTGYAHDPVEMGKQISATAIAGDALVLFDNLANGGLFGNPALDRALTGRTWRDRILGKLEMTPNLDLIAVFFASGNNTALCSDVARRIVQNRLECPHEHPEERTGFAIPDLLGHAAKNRGRLVVAALTILRAYILAGKPRQDLTPMDFIAWSGLIRNAVYWSTSVDPCADHHELADSNPERGQSAALVEAWYELQVATGYKGFTVAEMLRILGEDKDGLKYLSLRDALAELSSRTKPGELPSSGTIGKKIQAIRGQVFGNKRFVRIGAHNRAKVWGVALIS